MSPPGSVRAVITDLDGTIIRADGTVSDATRRAAATLAAAGVPLIVATARTPAGLAALDIVLPDIAVAVCCNGSLGYQPTTGKQIWRDALNPTTVTTIIDTIRGHLPDAGVGTYDGQQWTLTPTYFAARGTSPRGPHQLVPASQLSTNTICMLAVCHPRLTSAEIAEVLAAAGIGTELAAISFSADDVLDIAPPGIDKATGVLRALESLGVQPQHTIGFGDAPNDLPMFDLVGHAVAVANAHPSVLAAADSVTADVENDGFSNALAALAVSLPRTLRPGPDQPVTPGPI